MNISRGERANRGFRVGACAGAALGFSLASLCASSRALELLAAARSCSIDNDAAFLVLRDYVRSIPFAVVLCIPATVSFALIGGAIGILVAKLLYAPQHSP